MAMEDASQTRLIHRELCKRSVDFTNVDVRVIHGICYLRGYMQRLRSHPEVDLDSEAEIVRKILRQKPGIRDVVWEVHARGH